MYYEMGKCERTDTRGIVEVDEHGRITKLTEKPTENETPSRLASVVFYVFSRETLNSLPEFLRYTSIHFCNLHMLIEVTTVKKFI